MSRSVITVGKGEAAMEWLDIAEALGYGRTTRGKKAVFMIYRNAIRKLQARRGLMQQLKEIARRRADFHREARISESRLGGFRL